MPKKIKRKPGMSAGLARILSAAEGRNSGRGTRGVRFTDPIPPPSATAQRIASGHTPVPPVIGAQMERAMKKTDDAIDALNKAKKSMKIKKKGNTK